MTTEPRAHDASHATEAPAARRPLRRRAVLGVSALAVGLALGGCAITSPVQTDMPYQPADGVAVNLGSTDVRNLALVSAGKGKEAAVIGQVVNNGDAAVTISFGVEGTPGVTAEVPAHTSKTLSDAASQVTLSTLASAPGDIVRLTVSTKESGAVPVTVPVMAAEGYYTGLVGG